MTSKMVETVLKLRNGRSNILRLNPPSPNTKVQEDTAIIKGIEPIFPLSIFNESHS